MASDPNSPDHPSDVSEPIPNPSHTEEERLASISLEEPEGNHVAVSRLLSNGSSLPADFHAEDEIEVVEEELLGEGSSSHGGGGWREISEQDGEAVPCSPSSSGYAGERGSSGPSSGIEEVDDGVTLQDDWVPRKRHDDEDDASVSWRKRKKHFFILSHSGKPIYSRYGDEHKLAGFSATLQAIISFVENGGDRVKFVRAGKHQVVFLVKGPIYLVCISCTEEPYEALKGQLELIYGQISLSRRLRLPWSNSSIELEDLVQEMWCIDKDEVSSSYAIMRFNIVQLFDKSFRSSHLRKMIVDLEVPRFDSGGIISQDPALSYLRSENNLNKDQRGAIQKILSAKDYALVLGMPGTGKTSTMVHAVKALLLRGASILLTSYTNTAIDNLLLKLKTEDIDFVRIGRHEAIHDDIRGHCFSASETCTMEDIRERMEQVRIVEVTCLGINHPLLANKTFDICIMDEAGQITLPVAPGSLFILRCPWGL